MPRKYIRNKNVVRAEWTEENLILAIEKVKKGEISKNEAQRRYGIPIRTLSRRLITGNTTKSGLGPQASLGTENEKQLAAYIRRLASAGFAPDRTEIRSLAYQFAEKLGIQHKFSKEKQMAGQHWLTSFLERNSDIIVRQAEGTLQTPSSSTSKDSVISTETQSPLKTEITIPVHEETPIKIEEECCVSTSPEEISKKTGNPKLVKGAAKNRNLAVESAPSSLQQIPEEKNS